MNTTPAAAGYGPGSVQPQPYAHYDWSTNTTPHSTNTMSPAPYDPALNDPRAMSARTLSRTPSPTPSEVAELNRKTLIDFSAFKRKGFWMEKKTISAWAFFNLCYIAGALCGVDWECLADAEVRLRLVGIVLVELAGALVDMDSFGFRAPGAVIMSTVD